MARKPKKETGIFERPAGSGNWYVRYYDEFGKDKKKAAGTKTSAVQLLAKLKEEARLRKLGLRPSAEEEERQRLTVAELIEKYRKVFESKESARDNKRYAKVWIRVIGHLRASEVRPDDIEGWRVAQKGTMKPNTINNHTSFLRRIFNLGIQKGLVTSNPLGNGRVKPLKGIGRRERVISPEEETLLLPALQPRDRAAFVIVLYTGVRRGEVMRLRREDIDLSQRLAHLVTTKEGSQQSVPLSGLVLDAVRWVMESHDSEFLFPNAKGDGPATGDMLLYRLKKAAASVGLSGVLVHSLRHSFLTRVIEQGTDISTAQKLGRHSTITMTNSYVHTNDAAKREAVEMLARAAGHRPDLFPVARP
jgi:integrase